MTRTWKLPSAREVYYRLRSETRRDFGHEVSWKLFHALFLPHLDPDLRGEIRYQIGGYTWENYERGARWAIHVPVNVSLTMVARFPRGSLP
jgi:hypothetical protein